LEPVSFEQWLMARWVEIHTPFEVSWNFQDSGDGIAESCFT